MFFYSKKTQDSCAIFQERYLWYKHAKNIKNGSTYTFTIGFVKKESDFNWLAKPPRTKLFKVIPFKDPHHHLGILKH